MTLSTMLIGIGIAALLILAAQYLFKAKPESVWMSFLQNFVGVLFLFSGWVKAIDPLGTAYKMEQYFAEFESAFEPTWFGFIAPIFPVLNEYAISFSVIMIVFEIVLGLLILLGIYKKFAVWAFFLLVVFFTILTGFTYLTGYVPQDGTFFDFSSWSTYAKSNMKVTDCGCFGDFIKLEPKVSFFKDIFLLIPSVLFLLFFKKMHTLLKKKAAFWATIATLLLTTVYCFSNYVWDIPHLDFRPFKEGVDIQAQKLIEEEAMGNVQVVGFLMKNKLDPNKKLEISVADYSKYSDEWEVEEQIKTEPTLVPSKISEFTLKDIDENDAEYEILENENKSVVIVAYKLKGETIRSTETVVDTITVFDPESEEEMVKYVNKDIDVVDYQAQPEYAKKYTSKVVPFVDAAIEKGYDVFFLVGGTSAEEVQDFANDVNLNATVLTGDDILMKTIIRSNPGVMLLDKATVKKKYHIRKLPSFSENLIKE